MATRQHNSSILHRS